MRMRTIFLTLLLLGAASWAQAGAIQPQLQEELAAFGPDDAFSVIVLMSHQAPIAQLDAELKAANATLAERHLEVVSALKDAARSQGDFLSYLEARKAAGSVLGYSSYWIANLVVVKATKQEIWAIAARPDVEWIEPNFSVSLIEPTSRPSLSADEMGDREIGVPPGIRAIRAPEVWYQLGINGAGTLIGSMDTGVDGNHPALSARWRGTHEPWQECWLDLLGTNTQFPNDGNNHGTHTTGTMTGVAFNDSIGVAWGAEWIACNAINQGVSGAFDNDIIVGYQWFADPDANPNTLDDVPDVVQNSWRINEGFPGGYTDCDTRWWAVIDNAEAMGVITCWSAGNEGPGAHTIGSPPDRATTLTNAFSIGAVDATNFGWPYPIAGFSSRGPSGCTGVPPENLIKPEVCAPGVGVYSSVPGGGYQGGWDGTSMSGPHVAGTAALIRQANPNLDVNSVKTILMLTARDEGTAGEDNTYGHGFIDAYQAVLMSMEGYGQIEGFVRNGSYGNLPIPGAHVELIGTGFNFLSNQNGFYAGSAGANTYTARATRAGFAPQDVVVVIESDEVTVQDFSLTDIAGPEISNVSDPVATNDTAGPYEIDATIVDFSTVAEARLYYRYNEGAWQYGVMSTFGGNLYGANIPGHPAGTRIDFYVWAQDGAGLTSTDPAGAPNFGYYSLFITETLYAYSVEDPGDVNWTLGAPGDDADTGAWVREDPVGTVYLGAPVQPEDDHTANPGVKCFVTGNGTVGGPFGDADVDHGCTTLTSPTFDLSEAAMAFAKYWRWFGQNGFAVDDEFAVDVSDDGGATWTPLERVPGNENSWQEVAFDLGDFVDLNNQVKFRFVACDLDTGAQGLVEAAIDDFSLEVFSGDMTAVDWNPQSKRVATLLQSQPNPFRAGDAGTRIRFSLPRDAAAVLEVYDIAGRQVKTLAQGGFAAGDHEVMWTGQDDSGRNVSSGVYFYRLKVGGQIESRRLVMLR